MPGVIPQGRTIDRQSSIVYLITRSHHAVQPPAPAERDDMSEPEQIPIRCTILRGGTSKGVYLL